MLARITVFLLLIGIYFSTTVSGGITGVLKEERLPKQLFDIQLQLEDTLVYVGDPIIARAIFESFGTEPTPVNLTFLVINEKGEIFYKETDSITVETERVFTKKIENLSLKKGKYILILRTLYNEDVEDEFWKEFRVKKKIKFSLRQLFDIDFKIENPVVKEGGFLYTRVIFESFGTEPTPVDMDFTILDIEGKEIYTETDYTVVETEKVLPKKFNLRGFEPGKYTIILRTVYNVNITDEFKKEFEIKKAPSYKKWFFASFFLNLLFLFVIVLALSRKLNYYNREK